MHRARHVDHLAFAGRRRAGKEATLTTRPVLLGPGRRQVHHEVCGRVARVLTHDAEGLVAAALGNGAVERRREPRTGHCARTTCVQGHHARRTQDREGVTIAYGEVRMSAVITTRPHRARRRGPLSLWAH